MLVKYLEKAPLGPHEHTNELPPLELNYDESILMIAANAMTERCFVHNNVLRIASSYWL